MKAPRILVLAGEESGDSHGAAVVRAIRGRLPDASFIGIGGALLRAEGVELVAHLDRLAVMGFIEPIRHLPYFLRLLRRLQRLVRDREVDLVIPIDYPGFNMRVAATAREAGVPVLYYIVPQFWAWKGDRVHTLARDADRIAVILPFEEAPLRAAGARAEFVGHPLLERGVSEPEDRAEFSRRWGLDPDRPLLALFPGSRKQEVLRHLSIFTDAARILVGERPDLQVVVARAPSLDAGLFGENAESWVGDPTGLLRHSLGAIVKSGTSTLEAAVAGVPCVCAYRAHPLTYLWARRVVEIPHIALPNLVAGRRVIPELVQEEATAGRIADALSPLLDRGSDARRSMIRDFAEIRAALGGPGAAARVATMAAELLDSGRESAPGGEGDAR